jgi:pilus assembly protein CpaB
MAMISISILAAIGAVWVAARWVSQEAALSTSKIVVAAADIDTGAQLTGAMVKIADWPVGSVPQGAVNDQSKVIDRVVISALQRGEPVLESKLAPVGAKAGLSALVAKGNRAITVKVNEVVGVAGFALPGNYVDVMVNTTEEGGKTNEKDKSLSKIVLERILVLAVAQETTTDPNKPKVVNAVTLEVTPEQAERLDLARSVGTLSLVLRNQVDQEPVKTAGITKAKLLGRAPEKPVAVPASAPVQPVATAKPAPKKPPVKPLPAPTPKCVTVINGMETARECF